jgi:dihydrofolate reductase
VLALIVAFSENRVIGRDGGLPWRLPSDMQHFREVTMGHPVIMGRKTYESIPDRFRPLPGRRNVVLSRDPAYAAEGAEVFGDLASALQAATADDDVVCVIGGGTAYAEALPLADRVSATVVDGDVEGDTFFPALDPGEWRVTEESDRLAENGHTFRFVTYDRAR